MKLDYLFGAIAFICGTLGIGGIEGYLTFGTGLVQSVVLLIIASISSYVSLKEGGYLRKREKSCRRPKQTGQFINYIVIIPRRKRIFNEEQGKQ